MKIAYCILAHENKEHLKRLVASLRSHENPEAHFFLHIDKKSSLRVTAEELPDVEHVPAVEVHWGGFSMVDAALNLFQAAMEKGPFDYYVLISGVDYPIRSNAFINNFFAKNVGANFMNVVKMPGNGKTMDRVQFPYIQGADRTKGFVAFTKKVINKVVRVLNIRNSLPAEYKNIQFYGGSSWVTYSHEGLRYTLEYAKANPKFNAFFRHTKHPDEMYFQTILMNSPLAETQKNAIIYASWKEGAASPDIITSENLKEIRQSEVPTSYGISTPLFARKFHQQSTELLNEIDLIRKEIQ